MATDFASRFAMLVDDGTEGLSGRAIGLAIGIHRNYGPGLLEKAYVRLYADALRNAGHDVECQPRLTLMDGGRRVKNAYRQDIIVDRRLVIEAKAVIAILPVHKQQLTTYMRLTKIRVGLLINFNVPVLRHGIRRVLLTDE